MKQRFFNIKNLVKSLLVAGFITSISSPLLANKQVREGISSLELNPAVEFVTTRDMTDYIAVKFDSEFPVKFTITIKDNAGNTFFNKAYESSSFSKVFGLVNESPDSETNLFLTLQTSDGKAYKYTISKESTVIEDIQVTKI